MQFQNTLQITVFPGQHSLTARSNAYEGEPWYPYNCKLSHKPFQLKFDSSCFARVEKLETIVQVNFSILEQWGQEAFEKYICLSLSCRFARGVHESNI